MSGYDWDRPYVDQKDLSLFESQDSETTSLYGKNVKAVALSNVEYKARFEKLGNDRVMKDPPSCGRIFPGYLVVRKFGTPHEYETWMPDHVFEEIYELAPNQGSA